MTPPTATTAAVPSVTPILTIGDVASLSPRTPRFRAAGGWLSASDSTGAGREVGSVVRRRGKGSPVGTGAESYGASLGAPPTFAADPPATDGDAACEGKDPRRRNRRSRAMRWAVAPGERREGRRGYSSVRGVRRLLNGARARGRPRLERDAREKAPIRASALPQGSASCRRYLRLARCRRDLRAERRQMALPVPAPMTRPASTKPPWGRYPVAARPRKACSEKARLPALRR